MKPKSLELIFYVTLTKFLFTQSSLSNGNLLHWIGVMITTYTHKGGQHSVWYMQTCNEYLHLYSFIT